MFNVINITFISAVIDHPQLMMIQQNNFLTLQWYRGNMHLIETIP